MARLFGYEIKDKDEKKRGDWVAKAAMIGIPVTVKKKEKNNANN